MSSVHPARRRAERFAAAVDGSSTTALDPELLELVELVGALRERPEPTARSEFVADLRSQLLAAAETELVPARSRIVDDERRTTPERSRVRRRERRLAVALGGLAIVGATTSMSVAAQSALPGEVLYPLKRAIEDADSRLGPDERRGTELLAQAGDRLDEIDQLDADGWNDERTAAAQGALTTFAQQAVAASDLLLADYAETGSEQSVTELRTFTGESIEQLGTLETQLPDALRPALVAAAQALMDIDLQAAETCPECAGEGITELPVTLAASYPAPAEPAAGVPATDSQATADGGQPPVDLVPDPAGGVAVAAAPEPSTTPSPSPLEATADDLADTADDSGDTGGTGAAGDAKPGTSLTTGTGAKKGAKKKVDDVVKGVTGSVDGTTGGALDGLTGGQGSLPSVGAAVDGTLQGVGNTIGGLTTPK